MARKKSKTATQKQVKLQNGSTTASGVGVVATKKAPVSAKRKKNKAANAAAKVLAKAFSKKLGMVDDKKKKTSSNTTNPFQVETTTTTTTPPPEASDKVIQETKQRHERWLQSVRKRQQQLQNPAGDVFVAVPAAAASSSFKNAARSAEQAEFDRLRRSLHERESIVEWKRQTTTPTSAASGTDDAMTMDELPRGRSKKKRNGGRKKNQLQLQTSSNSNNNNTIQLQPPIFKLLDKDKSMQQLLWEASNQVQKLGVSDDNNNKKPFCLPPATVHTSALALWNQSSDANQQQAQPLSNNPWAVLDSDDEEDENRNAKSKRQTAAPTLFQFQPASFSFQSSFATTTAPTTAVVNDDQDPDL